MNKKRGQNILCIFLLMSLLSPISTASAKEGNIERAGDILQILIPVTAYGATYFLDDKDGRRQFYKSFFTNLGVTFALKLSINKERPNHSDNNSFPSGHTSAAFHGAAFIQKRYGWKYAIPAYVGATFVGYSRVYARKHYVEDVVAGAVIGIVSSYYFTTPYKTVTVTPVADNGFYGLTINETW